MSAEAVTLPDGRTLDVRTTGPDDGDILLFHHGTPGAGLAFKPMAEAAAGQTAQATQRLERLASRLLASGERGLAKTALVEAQRLSSTRTISAEGQKTLKFGTRGLIRPGQVDK